MDYLSYTQAVFDTWAAAMLTTEVGDRVFMERSTREIVYPCASLFPLPSGELGYDLDNAPAGTELSYQIDIEVKTDDLLSNLYQISAVSHEAMCSMGFRMTSQASPEQPQSGYKRLITRYSRVIGYGETIQS